MCRTFGSNVFIPSSSATEASFRVLKQNVFKGDNQLRIDKWIAKHLNFLHGSIERGDVKDEEEDDEDVEDVEDEEEGTEFTQLDETEHIEAIDRTLNESIDSTRNESIESTHNESIDSTHYESMEESELIETQSIDSNDAGESDPFDSSTKRDVWRTINENKNQPRAPLKRATNSILNPDRYSSYIPIFANGYTSKYDSYRLTTFHTCAFDSLFSFYLACYMDIAQFKQVIINNLRSSSVLITFSLETVVLPNRNHINKN